MKGLKSKRIALGLSPGELSEKIGVSLQAIYYYEKGERFPRREILAKLTKYFNCTIDALM